MASDDGDGDADVDVCDDLDESGVLVTSFSKWPAVGQKASILLLWQNHDDCFGDPGSKIAV